MTWAELAVTVERWALPAECMTCGASVGEEGEPLVCATCRLRWRTLPNPVCPTCGEPADLGLTCRLCADWPRGFGPVRSAVRLDEPARALVHAFKYEGWRRLADAFALRMAPLLDTWPDGELVPVPLARGRARHRGYNQAACLADALGRRSGRVVRPGRLRRVRETPSQTRLAPAARLANLQGAFEAPRCPVAVILVDDVFTTGATLCSAATALLDAGAPAVGAVTFARAAPPLSAPAARLGRQATQTDD